MTLSRKTPLARLRLSSLTVLAVVMGSIGMTSVASAAPFSTSLAVADHDQSGSVHLHEASLKKLLKLKKLKKSKKIKQSKKYDDHRAHDHHLRHIATYKTVDGYHVKVFEDGNGYHHFEKFRVY